MKKLFTLGCAAMLTASAMADAPSITLLKDGIYYGGYMPECISANGEYICGSTYAGAGFVGTWRDNNLWVLLEDDGSQFADYGCDLPFVTNNGVAVGFDDISPMTVNFNTRKIDHMRVNGLIDSMTQDGNIFVGMIYTKQESQFITPHKIDYQAGYWENGVAKLLPIPTEEELGYYIQGSRARCISADGSVILGELVDRLQTRPMVLWFRQPDGSYKLDAVCMKYFTDIRDNFGKYMEYVNFHGDALSQNGKWVAMTLRESPEYNKPVSAPFMLGLYNTETGEITKARYTEDGPVELGEKVSVFWNGISDAGTVIGTYTNQMGGGSSFIMYADQMELRNIADVFNTLGPLADFEDQGVNMVSGISADGRYLTGMGYGEDYTYHVEYYMGYVLDMGMTDNERTAVEGIEADDFAGEPVYYDIQGRRVANPDRGIYIRVTGTKSEKVIL